MGLLTHIYNWIINKVNHYITLVILTLIAVCLDIAIYIGIPVAYDEYINYKVAAIYQQIIVSSGQTQDALPLVISDDEVDNAYNDGHQIVIYKGLINHTASWDEVALVLGHETAHGMLAHLNKIPPFNDGHSDDGTGEADHIAVLEANADKMGSLYLLKSGYNICKGRQLFKHWLETQGDFLGLNHPDNAYRYHQLNINCGEF